jgi:hypothetical protein
VVPFWSSRDLEISRPRHLTIGAQLLLPEAVGSAVTEIISLSQHQVSTQQGARFGRGRRASTTLVNFV